MNPDEKLKIGPVSIKRRTYIVLKCAELVLLAAGSAVSFGFLRHNSFWLWKHLWLILLIALVMEGAETLINLRKNGRTGMGGQS